MDKDNNFYTILGVPHNATPKEIRRAYHAAARRFHPDVNKDPNAGTVFLKIQEAYETLTNPDERIKYNKSHSIEQDVPPCTLNIIYSRSSLVQLDEPQLIYALIEMKTSQRYEEKKLAPLNVCLVLDRSTSMQGARLEVVKETAIELVQQLNPKDSLSIVSFSDHAEVLIPSGLQIDKKTVVNRIRQLHASGGTEIFRGLEAGYKEIRRNLRPSNINHLILITDGRTYGDEQDCIDLATQSASIGIGLSGLGIGSQWNDVFMDNLANRSGGNCTYISSADDIAEFFKKEVRSLSQVFAEGVTLDIDTGPDVEIRYAFRLEPEIAGLETKLPIPLGNIQMDTALRVILELLVPAISSGSSQVLLAEGSLRLNIPSRKVPVYNMPIFLERPVTEAPNPQPPPAEILLATEKITLYRMQEKARQEFSAGDINNATRHLENLASRLSSLRKHKLAQTVLFEAENLKRQNKYSEEGDKKIKYGTRALFLPDITDGNIL
jgi:Ca-activated chloride channel family protein